VDAPLSLTAPRLETERLVLGSSTDDLDFRFAVERRDDGASVGMVRLRVELDHRRAGLGYWIDPGHRGRGYATEAAGAALRYAFEQLDLNRVIAEVVVPNPASERVAEKLGMRLEGTRRQHTFRSGRFHDTHIYGILRTEWAERST
jgi:RimJ/RimL family protein N-acetyltransferase